MLPFLLLTTRNRIGCGLSADFIKAIVLTDLLVCLCCTAQSKCEPVLERFNFKWPPVLDCSRLPDGDSDRSQLCIDPPPAGDELDDAFGHAPANSFQLRQLLDALRSGPNSSSWRQHDVIGTSPASRGVSPVMTLRGSVCSSQRYVMTDAGSSSSSSSTCRPRCGVDVLYSSNDKRSVCFLLTTWFYVVCVCARCVYCTQVFNSKKEKREREKEKV